MGGENPKLINSLCSGGKTGLKYKGQSAHFVYWSASRLIITVQSGTVENEAVLALGHTKKLMLMRKKSASNVW
jgi:hypothetical protein